MKERNKTRSQEEEDKRRRKRRKHGAMREQKTEDSQRPRVSQLSLSPNFSLQLKHRNFEKDLFSLDWILKSNEIFMKILVRQHLVTAHEE